jgi:hypothetical protein
MTPRVPPLRRPRQTVPFYERALSAAEREGFEEARALRGIDDEIALLRLRLRDALIDQPDDFDLLLGGVRLLIQALLAQRRLSGQQADELAETLVTIVEGFADSVKGIVNE